LEEAREVLSAGDPVLLAGDVKFERDRQASDDQPADAKLVPVEVAPLAASLRARTKAVRVRLTVERTDPSKIAALKKALDASPGPCPVSLEIVSSERWTVSVADTGLSVEPSEDLLSALERLFGEKICELR